MNRRLLQPLTLLALAPMLVGLPVLWSLGYVLGLAAFLVVIVPLFICRHCPHWAADGWYLTCGAHWGVPKIYTAVGQPLNAGQRLCVHLGFVAIFGTPVILLEIHGERALALCSGVLALAWYGLLRAAWCPTCANYRCPYSGRRG
jgi:hypothetical protein